MPACLPTACQTSNTAGPHTGLGALRAAQQPLAAPTADTCLVGYCSIRSLCLFLLLARLSRLWGVCRGAHDCAGPGGARLAVACASLARMSLDSCQCSGFLAACGLPRAGAPVTTTAAFREVEHTNAAVGECKCGARNVGQKLTTTRARWEARHVHRSEAGRMPLSLIHCAVTCPLLLRSLLPALNGTLRLPRVPHAGSPRPGQP